MVVLIPVPQAASTYPTRHNILFHFSNARRGSLTRPSTRLLSARRVPQAFFPSHPDRLYVQSAHRATRGPNWANRRAVLAKQAPSGLIVGDVIRVRQALHNPPMLRPPASRAKWASTIRVMGRRLVRPLPRVFSLRIQWAPLLAPCANPVNFPLVLQRLARTAARSLIVFSRVQPCVMSAPPFL